MTHISKLAIAGVFALGMVSLNAGMAGSAAASAATSTGKTFAIAKNGENVSIEGVKGQVVVLEWLNHDCPIVVRHYKSGYMQSLQEKYTKQGVKWYSIVSSAPGKQGHVDAATAEKLKAMKKSFATDIVLDETSAIGRMFAAKTTPHMIVIGKNGEIVYDGAIDSNRSGRDAEVKEHTAEGIEAAMAGRAAPVARTQPYGCGVKY